MKKAIWIIAVLGLVLLAAALLYLPETVPVHFDAAWNPDRWGSRWELLLLPAALLLMAGVFTAVMNAWEKKSEETEEDKARAGALTNRKAIGIAGISTLSMLLLVFAWLMLRIFRAASGGETAGDALDRLPFILMGILFIVLGNVMPKTRRNEFFGFRTSWSMYNDETWRKTHRFGGYALVIAGILTVIAAAALPGFLATLLAMLVLLTAAVVGILLYSRRVCLRERERTEEG